MTQDLDDPDLEPVPPAASTVPAQTTPGSAANDLNNPDYEEVNLNTLGQTLGAGLESALKTVSFGASAPIESWVGKALGIPELSAEEQQAREEAHPIASIIGGGVGFGTGIGAAGLTAMAGKAGAAALGKAVSPILSAAVRVGIEGALLQGGNENAKLLTDAPQTAGTAAIDIGLSGLIGAGFGAAGAGVSSLWSARNGAKVASSLDAAKDALTNESAAQAGLAMEKATSSLAAAPGITALKENAPEIIDAINGLGIKKPTPELLSASTIVQGGVPTLAERPTFGGVLLKAPYAVHAVLVEVEVELGHASGPLQRRAYLGDPRRR